MSEPALRGLAAAPGVGVGRIRLLAPALDDGPFHGHEIEQARALAALETEADAMAASAARLRRDGLRAEAEILEANRLMALDPLLQSEVERLTRRLTAAEALQGAAQRHAELLAQLPDPVLAARAADVRELGRRAARTLAGGVRLTTPDDEPLVFVADDLGPADVADLRESGEPIVAIALASGAATSHAAIMARSLGLPMVVSAGDDVLLLEDGATLVVDGDRGLLYPEPDVAREAWARAEMKRLADERRAFARERELPPVTLDGRWISLLGNAATAVEVRAVLAAEAEGVGLLRTELAFLDARDWPSEAEHLAALTPLLALLHGQLATIRVLDFGEDKTPPFLAGTAERGIALLLAHPEALNAQLRALLAALGDCIPRVLLPLVESPAQLQTVRALLRAAAAGAEPPPLGAMIETPAGVRRIRELALEADFISIGTNDLVQYTLGIDRTEPLATARSAADPAVLRLVAETVAGAHEAGLTVEVCGEAASVPELVVLFVGLGVDELSLAPARLDEVRSTVRAISATEAASAAAGALEAASADEAISLARSLLSAQARNEPSELFGGLDGVVA